MRGASRRLITALIGFAAVALTVHPASAASPSSRSAATASLTISAPTSYSAHLSWLLPSTVTTVGIYRQNRLIDQFPASSGTSYTDYLLWQRTTYRYELRAYNQSGTRVADIVRTVTTPAKVGPFPRSYAANSFFNTPIPGTAAADPNSRAMMSASILPWQAVTVIDNDNAWGIPLAYANPVSERYDVGCTKYLCDTSINFSIPRYAQPNTGSDGHLAVYDPSTNQELDMWQGTHDRQNNSWTASTRTATTADWGAVCPLGTRCGGGGVAAGFLEWGGTIRPEEIAQGRIDHALTITSPHIRSGYISCPATNYWASRSPNYVADPNALPLGAHIQLSPSLNVGAQPWPRWEKVVARALQTYGAYVVDVGEDVALRGEANIDRGYDAWAKVGMTTVPHERLSNLPWSQFRVLQLQPC
jgi:hypothetical protein